MAGSKSKFKFDEYNTKLLNELIKHSTVTQQTWSTGLVQNVRTFHMICFHCKQSFDRLESTLKISLRKSKKNIDEQLCQRCFIDTVASKNLEATIIERQEMCAAGKMRTTNTSNFIGVCYAKKKGVVIGVAAEIGYYGKQKRIHISSVYKDVPLELLAWLRDDFIRTNKLPHTLNFTDDQHLELEKIYGNHKKIDWR